MLDINGKKNIILKVSFKYMYLLMITANTNEKSNPIGTTNNKIILCNNERLNIVSVNNSLKLSNPIKLASPIPLIKLQSVKLKINEDTKGTKVIKEAPINKGSINK